MISLTSPHAKQSHTLRFQFNNELKLKGFNVFQIESDGNATRIYSRKDFYKICLTTGQSIIHYADRSFETEGTVLFFGNPHIPYSWETISTEYVGYTCLFPKSFSTCLNAPKAFNSLPLFKVGGTPVLNISTEQRAFLNVIFQKMIEEQQSDYVHKADLMRNYIHLILHEALKLQPSENYYQHQNTGFQNHSVFLELLERQFPIESVDKPLRLKTPQDFANGLAVRVNRLNRSVKEITGKPTSKHISARIITEAKALLLHTDWTIAEVAYALGFEYPSYFNNYFKRVTGKIPSSIRTEMVWKP